MTKEQWDKIEVTQFYEAIEKHKVDENVFASICAVESSGQQFAIRYEPHFRWTYYPTEFASNLTITRSTEIMFQKTSFGLCQLMGANFRLLGFNGYLSQCCDLDINLDYGAKFLKTLYDKYGNESDVISAYNQGSPRRTRGGLYRNEKYVDAVYKYIRMREKTQL